MSLLFINCYVIDNWKMNYSQALHAFILFKVLLPWLFQNGLSKLYNGSNVLMLTLSSSEYLFQC